MDINRRWSLRSAVLLFTIFFSLYIRSAANQVFTADCGELTAASYVLGIPHATGYSTYCLMNRFAAQSLPLGNIAFRSSVVSALFGSLALVFFFLYLADVFSLIPAFCGSALWGVSLTFWSQANIQEVYSLHMFFLSILLFLAGKVASGFSLSKFYILFFFMGLSLTNHALSIFCFPALLVYIWPRKTFWTTYKAKLPQLTAGVGFGILGMSILLYFPLRSLVESVILWKHCDRVDAFLYHITGRQFRTLMFDQSFSDIALNFLNYLEKLSFQFPWVFFIFGGYGVYVLFKRRRTLFYVFTIYFISVMLFILQYRIIDIEVYFLQSYFAVTVFIVAGINDVFHRIHPNFRNLSRAGLLFFLFGSVFFLMVKNYWINDRSRNYLIYDWGINVYNSVPPDALLVTQGWSSPFVFFYLDHVMNYRPDILVQVDYKGSTFFQAANQGWEIPVVSTLPVEDQEAFVIHGVVYQFEQHDPAAVSLPEYQAYMRTRSLWDSSIFLDFHSQAIKAKYLIIEGFWALDSGDRTQSEKKFREAETEAQSNPLIFNNLSCVYFKLGDYEKAEEMALKALDLDSNLVPAHHNLGNALLKQGRYQEAISAFEEAKENVVSLGRQREALGYLYLLMDDCDRAIMEFRRALSVSPLSQTARINLGISQQRCGNYTEALSTFTGLINNGVKNPDVFINRANVYIALSDHEKAMSDLAIVLERSPGNFEARLSKSVILYESGRETEAIELLHTLKREHPESTSVLNNLGLIAFTREDYQSAIEYWETSIDLNPDQPHIRQSLRELRFDRNLFNNRN
jgi:tetratricopeptide (TPR) repeat protein